MPELEDAILRTVLYADVFDFPLTVEEIQHFLISDTATRLKEIEHTLNTSQRLNAAFVRAHGYIVCRDREANIARRIEREQIVRQLWPLAMRYGVWLARLPFVRMVALTGALAVHNPAALDDDLDYLLVTRVGRVWLARAFAVLLVRLVRLRGVVICPNFVLAENALTQNRQDLFLAHEVTQMVPVYGHTLYMQMRDQNAWVSAQLPNAQEAFYAEPERSVGRGWAAVKGLLESLLGGRPGNALEQWEYRRKLRRFAPETQTPQSDARLDSTQVKGHFNDHGQRILAQYHKRLRQHGLLHDDSSGYALRATGD